MTAEPAERIPDQIELFDAAGIHDGTSDGPVPIDSLPSRTVVPDPYGTVSDVLVAAGFGAANSFSLLTRRVAADARLGMDSAVAFDRDLVGLDPRGRLISGQSTQTLLVDFVRAVDAGIYDGDPARLVVFDYGVAGGAGIHDLMELAQTIFDARELIGLSITTGVGLEKFAQWIRRGSRERQAQRLARTGNVSPAMRSWLSDDEEFSTQSFVAAFPMGAAEAASALRGLNYQLGLDDLWRPRTPQLAIDMSQWVGGHDGFTTDSFAGAFELPDREARIMLHGYGLSPGTDGLWRHLP